MIPCPVNTSAPSVASFLQDIELDQCPELMVFNAEGKNPRARYGVLLDPVRSTMIGAPTRDTHGHRLPMSRIALMTRLRKLQRRCKIYGSRERNLVHGLSELDGLVDRLYLSSFVREEAEKTYRRALEREIWSKVGVSRRWWLRACTPPAGSQDPPGRYARSVSRAH